MLEGGSARAGGGCAYACDTSRTFCQPANDGTEGSGVGCQVCSQDRTPISRHWALVGPFDVVPATPRVLPRSLAMSGVLGGGRSGPGSPLPGLA